MLKAARSRAVSRRRSRPRGEGVSPRLGERPRAALVSESETRLDETGDGHRDRHLVVGLDRALAVEFETREHRIGVGGRTADPVAEKTRPGLLAVAGEHRAVHATRRVEIRYRDLDRSLPANGGGESETSGERAALLDGRFGHGGERGGAPDVRTSADPLHL